MSAVNPGPVVVIPCSHGQLPRPARAADLYVGSYHRWCRATAEALTADGGTVLVLSARYGLVALDGDEILKPYDQRLGHVGVLFERRLLVQARDLDVTHAHDVTVLAGAAYVDAARRVWPHATAPLARLGIGYQRQRLAELRARATQPTAPQPAEVNAPAAPPLYTLRNDWTERTRVFTVVIAGPERHDGEAPFRVVVEDHSTNRAWAQAMAWFMVNQETIDAYVIAGESHEGLPVSNGRRGIAFFDLRAEPYGDR
ncbi:DUF6884 domain-containing protein [Embleya sp. NPDC001921]